MIVAAIRHSSTPRMSLKWYPMPYKVHWFRPGPIGLWSKDMHYRHIGYRVLFGSWRKNLTEMDKNKYICHFCSDINKILCLMILFYLTI